jgi:hypothetical protein
MRSARVSLACVVLLLATAGCGGQASVNQASAPCATRVPAAHPADTLTVVVFDKIDLSHAPWPQNRSERFVFSHLYETLVKVDCHGVVQPGIAKSWKEASDGWYFEIQEDAHFWDDTPVTAADIQTSFQMRQVGAGVGIVSVDIVDATHAIIHGAKNVDIKLFAQPMLAITNGSISAPMGTGAWQVDPDSSKGFAIHPSTGQGPTVRFVQSNRSQALDLVGSQADAMISDDPSVVEYARDRSLAAMPLAWDQAYVFVSGSRYCALPETSPPGELPVALSDELARDAVSVDARGGSSILSAPRSVSFLRMGGSELPRRVTMKELSRRIVYVSEDKTARGLAERLVAIAAMDTTKAPKASALARAIPELGPDVRASGLSPSQFQFALGKHLEFGYVLSLSWIADYPHLLGPFSDGVWPVGRTSTMEGRLLTGAMIPLIETRAHFIALSDRIGFTYDAAGNVSLIPPGAERVR